MKIYRLNEQQATLLITYLRNTEPVRKFKMNLVKAFFVNA
ncbi:phage protein [Streptococcus pneumoniae 8190-05]|nr:phage protein [Streptococcus pneumoniae 8190-05]